jgi:hypothetical protein
MEILFWLATSTGLTAVTLLASSALSYPFFSEYTTSHLFVNASNSLTYSHTDMGAVHFFAPRWEVANEKEKNGEERDHESQEERTATSVQKQVSAGLRDVLGMTQ